MKNKGLQLILCLIAFFLATSGTRAQVSNYSFTPSAGTFTEITAAGGATVMTLSGGSLDDGYYNNIPIGFNFNFDGSIYSMASASTNGFLLLGATMTTSYASNNLATGTPRPKIAPLWDDIEVGSTGSFSYQTEGTTPNRIFTAQWLNMYWNYSGTVPAISFQVKIYETTNNIEFIYRQETATLTSPSASIGICSVATGAGNYLSLNNASASPTASSTTETTSIAAKPATGQIYAFAPPVATQPPNCANIGYPPDLSTSIPISPGLTWSGGGGVPDGFLLYFGDDGGGVTTPTNIVNGADTTSPFTPTVPLNYTTTYYWQVVPYNSYGSATGCPIWSFTTRNDPTVAPPWTENFNAGTTLPLDWVSDMYISATHGATGTNGLYRNLYSSVPNCNATTPPVGPVTTNSLLEFDYRIVNYSSYPSTATVLGPNDKIYVMVSANAGITYDTLYTISSANHITSTQFVTISNSLAAYDGAVVNVKIRGVWGTGDYYVDFDNFTIFDNTVPPGCTNPVYPANAATGIGAYPAISWAGASGATGYTVYLGTDGGGTATPTDVLNGVDLTSPYVPAAALLYNTTYYWQIVPYNAYGSATGCPIWSFTTMPDPTVYSFPYLETFETFTTGSPGTLTNNWTRTPASGFTWYVNAGSTSSSSTGPDIDHTLGTATGKYLFTEASNGSVGNETDLISPPLDLSLLSNPQLDFWYHMYGSTMGSLHVDVTAGGGNWVLDVMPPLVGQQQTTGAAPWLQAFVSLNAFAGQTVQVRFRGIRGTDFYGDMAIDDVNFGEALLGVPPCATLGNPPDGAVDLTSHPAFSWLSGGAPPADGYQLYLGTDGGGTATPTSVENGTVVTSPWAPSIALDYSTTYYWQIIPFNTSGDATGCPIRSFTTMADPTVTTFPFNEGFETAVPPFTWQEVVVNPGTGTAPDWSQVNAGTSPTCNPHEGTMMAKFNSYNAGSNSTSRLVTPPLDFSSITTPTLAFWMYHDPGYATYLNEGVQIQASTDGINWVNMGSLFQRYSATAHWEQHFVALDTFAFQIVYLGFLGVSQIGNNCFIDEVSVAEAAGPPPCANLITPANGATDIVNTTPLVWQPGGAPPATGYRLYFGTDGGGVATPSDIENGTVLTSPYTPAVTLAYSTTYYWQVIPFNAYGDAQGCPINSFTVMADPYTVSFPYNQGFEISVPPPAWQEVVVNPGTGTAPDWTQESTGASPTCSPHQGTYMAKFNSYSAGSGSEARISTPRLDFSSLSSPQLSFWMYHDNGYNSYLQEGVQVQISTDSLVWSNVDNLFQRVSATNQWQQHFVSLSTYAGQSVFVGFLGHSQFGNNCFIDEVSIADGVGAPPCATLGTPANADTGVSVTPNLTWTPGGVPLPDGYRLYFGTDGGGITPPTNLENGTVVTSPYTPPAPLTYLTTYYWQIVPFNTYGDATGCPIRSFTTRTDPTVYILPYTEDFETFITGTPGTLKNNWTVNPASGFTWYVNAGPTSTASTGPDVDHTTGTATGKYMYTESSNGSLGSEADLISPPIALSSLTNPMLDFWYHMYGATTGSLHVDVSVIGGSWNLDVMPALTGQQQTSGTDPYYQAFLSLSNYIGQTVQVRFRALRGTGDTGDIGIDDITFSEALVGIPPCANLITPADSAIDLPPFPSFSWIGGGSPPADGYKLYLGTDGGGITTPTNVENGTVVTSPWIPTTALSYLTTYYWQIIPYTATGSATGCPIRQFTVMADPTISTFPYNEGFEISVPPPNWHEVIVNPGSGTLPDWTQVTTGTYPTCAPHEGANMAKFNSFNASSGSTDRLETPPLNFGSLSAPLLSFWMFHDPGYSSYTNEGVQVQVSTNGITWTNLGSFLQRLGAVEQWEEHFVSLDTFAGQTIYLGFLGVSQFGNNIYIDEISVAEAAGTPPCANLSSPANGATGTTNYPALTWSGGGAPPASGYKLFFGTDGGGTIPPTNIENGTVVASPYIPATALTYLATYYWQIVPFNSFGDATGCPIYSFTVMADPTVSTFPLTEGFETAVPPPGWQETIVSGTTADWLQASVGLHPTTCTPHEGSQMARFNSYSCSAGQMARLSTPPLDFTNVASPGISFWMYHDPGYNTYLTEGVRIQVSANGVNWTNVDSLFVRTDPVAHWAQHNVDLSVYSGQVVYVGILGVSQYGNDCYVDEVMIANQGFAAYTGPDASICQGGSAQLNVTVLYGVPPFTFLWSPATGLNDPTLQNPVATPAATTTYTVQVTDSTGATVSDNITITVMPLPTVTLAAFSPVCINWPPFPLTGGSPAGGTYSGPGVTGNNFNPGVAGIGTHNITYTYADPNGCSNSAIQPLVVSPCTGLDETSGLVKLNIYPNPSTGQFDLQVSGLKGKAEITILNLQGQSVWNTAAELQNEAFKAHLDLSSVPKGIYYLKITGDKGMTVEKIVIQ